MVLSIAIQHHPSRTHLIPALLASLPGAEVVEDPEPLGRRSAWRTYRRCIELTPELATHRLIIQDDVILCPNFTQAAERAIAAHPDALVAFYDGGEQSDNTWKVNAARMQGDAWVQLDVHRWIPVLALSWPAEHTIGLLEFVDAQHWPVEFVADDEIVGRYAREAGLLAFATCPSLVDHTDELSIGRKPQASYEGRRATWFIGSDDPLGIDWG